MSEAEVSINCRCYPSPSVSLSRTVSLSVSCIKSPSLRRNNSLSQRRRHSLPGTPNQLRHILFDSPSNPQSPRSPLRRRHSLSFRGRTAAEVSPPFVTPPEVRRFRNPVKSATPKPTPKLPHQDEMTRSIFSFFQKTKVGRGLAYAVGSSNDRRGSLLSEISLPPQQSYCHRMGFKDANARKVEKFMTQPFWSVLSVVCTITSLLAYDFTIAFLPKEVDISTDIILLFVFVFFFVELIVASLVRRGYFLSFWFWLDFIAMVSMIPDLALLLQLFGAGTGDVNVANTQASKAGKSGRSAVALKAIRMVRFSRLIRVLRVFKFFQDDDDLEEEKENAIDTGSTKVGQIVSEAITKKVIVLVLVLVLLLPWMDPSGTSYSEGATTSANLYKLLIQNDADPTEATNAFHAVGVPILKITIDGVDIMDEQHIMNQRRDIELWHLPLGDDMNDNVVVFDIRDNIVEEAHLGMCLTLFAIVVFAVSTSFVAAATMAMVVEPIAKLCELLKKMAGVIGILGGASAMQNMMEQEDELFIVEALCKRIMDIFGTSSSNQNSGGKSSNSKAISMMASHKVTHITSGDRVWEIDVKEKHRTSMIEKKVRKKFSEFAKEEQKQQQEDESDSRFDSVNSSKLPAELMSLQRIVANPITLYCLRMFMQTNLTINNLLFILEAEDWAKTSRKPFHTLYNKYCSQKSPAQINLNAAKFARIDKVYKNEAELNEHVFDEAIEETWDLMERNLFKQFLDSDYCKFYIHMRNNDPFTLNQLQLSVATKKEQQQKAHRFIRTSESSLFQGPESK